MPTLSSKQAIKPLFLLNVYSALLFAAPLAVVLFGVQVETPENWLPPAIMFVLGGLWWWQWRQKHEQAHKWGFRRTGVSLNRIHDSDRILLNCYVYVDGLITRRQALAGVTAPLLPTLIVTAAAVPFLVQPASHPWLFALQCALIGILIISWAGFWQDLTWLAWIVAFPPGTQFEDKGKSLEVRTDHQPNRAIAWLLLALITVITTAVLVAWVRILFGWFDLWRFLV